jgi:hypothetical protein
MKQLKSAKGQLISLKPSPDGSRIRVRLVKQPGVQLEKEIIDINNLTIFGLPCYATFANEGTKIVVLLRY